MESAENQAQPPNKTDSPNNPPLSKTETIALLNESIDRLEETIQKISQGSAKIPSSASLDTLLTTTQELEAAVTSTDEVFPVSAVPQATQGTVTQPATNVSQPTAPTANTVPKPKRLPNKPRRIASLVIGVTAIAIAFVTVFWLWKPQQFANLLTQAEPTEVAIAPANEIELPSAIPLKELPDEPVDNVGIVSDISAMDFPEEIESVAEPIEDVVETVIPEELTAPERPKKLKMVAIKPKLSFTPEQNLVATLETKISELIETYPQEFIEEVRVDLPDSSLLVRVADDWYDLDESERNSLGNKILERARAFSFEKLKLQDSLGTLVARNPIIGDNIILVQDSRQRS